MKYLTVAVVMIAILLTASAVADQYVLEDFEGELEGWASGVQVVEMDGNRVLKWTPTGTGPHFLQFTYDGDAVEMNRWDTLVFRYRIEEATPDWWGVKVIDAPLQDGYTAVYRVPSSDLKTGTWAEARFDLQEPNAVWGDEPNLKAENLTLRLERGDADSVVHVDDIRLIRQPVKLELDAAGDCIRTDDGTARKITLGLANRLDETVGVALSVTSDRTVQTDLPETVSVPAGERTQVGGTVHLAHSATLPPLHRMECTITASAQGDQDLSAIGVAMAVPLPDIGHPCLMLTQEDIPRLRQRIKEHKWAKDVFESLRKSADDWLDEQIHPPEQGGQWSHWYTCEKCGARLQTKTPTLHVCPNCGAKYAGWPYDQVVIMREHRALSGAVETLGLVYALTGEKEYADKAAEILTGYAEKYLDYPLHTKNGPSPKGVHVGSAGLQESTWLIPLVHGFDCIYDTLDDAERELIADRLLLPAADLIRGFANHIHNIPCWENSAYGMVGLTLGDSELASSAINGEYGFRNQIEKGVNDDGQWYEGAWGYHFYTMSALQPLAIAAEHFGIGLYTDRYRSMFEAPVRMMGPTGLLPAFNDSHRTPALTRGSLYENAWSHWQSPEIAIVLNQDPGRGRSALLYGAEEIPPARARLSSSIFPAAGQVILRTGVSSGSGGIPGVPENCVILDYGPHGGWHGHPDKLGFESWGRAALMGTDAGSTAYGNPASSGWFKQTLSHNTVVVDGGSQQTCEGELLSSAFGEDAAFCVATADEAYEGVQLTRIMALLDDRILDLVVASSDQAHEYDWAYHNKGELATDLSARELDSSPDEGSYEWAEQWRSLGSHDTWSGRWNLQTGPIVRLVQDVIAPSEIFSAIGRGNPGGARDPFVMVRQQTKDAAWASMMLFGPTQENPEVRLLIPKDTETLRRGNISVGLESKAGDTREILLYTDTGQMSAAGVTLTGRAALLRWERGRLTSVLLDDSSAISAATAMP